MQLTLLLPTHYILIRLPELSVCLSLRKTKPKVILIYRCILEYFTALEVLHRPCRTSHYNSSINMLFRYVIYYPLHTFDAGAPTANETEKDIVSDVWAQLTLAHIMMEFSQCFWY